MALGYFDTETGNGWRTGGSRHDFVFPEGYDTFIPPCDLVPGNSIVDSYLDLPYPQIPSGGEIINNKPSLNPNPNGVAFNTRIWRLTRDGYDHPEYRGAWTFNSEVCYWNKNGTRLILKDWDPDVGIANKQSTWLFDGNGKRDRKVTVNNPGANVAWQQSNWRWALANYYVDGGNQSFDPDDTFYYVKGDGVYIYTLDATASGYTLLKKWSWAGYNSYDTAGKEGDISYDGQYMVIGATRASDSKYVIFRINLITGAKSSDSHTSRDLSTYLDYARVSPSGDYVIIAWNTNYNDRNDMGTEKGMEIYEASTMNRIRSACPGINHWDMYMDADGVDWVISNAVFTHHDILFGYTSPLIQPADFFKCKVDSNSTESWNNTSLIRDRFQGLLKWFGNGTYPNKTYGCCHCLNDPTCIYIGTWKMDARGWNSNHFNEGWWWPLYGEIIETPTSGSAFGEHTNTARRLCHTRARQFVKYDGSNYLTGKAAQPDFNINRQGTKIVFCSTMGQLARDVFMFNVNKGENYDDWRPDNPPSEYDDMDDPPEDSDPDIHDFEPPQPPTPPKNNNDSDGPGGSGNNQTLISGDVKKAIKLYQDTGAPIDEDKIVKWKDEDGKEVNAIRVDNRGNYVAGFKKSGVHQLMVDDEDDAEIDSAGIETDDVVE